jgi:hypothetical protein
MPNPDRKKLLAFLDQTRPFLVRYMAVIHGKRKKARLIPLTQIVKDSGLSRRLVQRLSQCTTWEGVKIGVASNFIHACRVDVMHNRAPHGEDQSLMTRYYFLKNYIEKGMPHLTERQRVWFYDLMGRR